MIKRQVWLLIVRSSQAHFKPQNIVQLLPVVHNKVVCTTNRLDGYSLVKYHGGGSLPIISHMDTALVACIVTDAHIVKDRQGSMHVIKSLTLQRIRFGARAVHLTHAGQVVTKWIKNCTACIKELAPHTVVKIADRFNLMHGGAEEGLFAMIGLDILGPVVIKTRHNTRNTVHQKLYILSIVCQLTGAVTLEYMLDYSTDSFLAALASHCYRYRTPRTITGDRGNQIECGTKRITRSQTDNSDIVDDGINKLLEGARKQLGDIEIYLAPIEAQHHNGRCEAANKLIKRLAEITEETDNWPFLQCY